MFNKDVIISGSLLHSRTQVFFICRNFQLNNCVFQRVLGLFQPVFFSTDCLTLFFTYVLCPPVLPRVGFPPKSFPHQVFCTQVFFAHRFCSPSFFPLCSFRLGCFKFNLSILVISPFCLFYSAFFTIRPIKTKHFFPLGFF